MRCDGLGGRGCAWDDVVVGVVDVALVEPQLRVEAVDGVARSGLRRSCADDVGCCRGLGCRCAVAALDVDAVDVDFREVRRLMDRGPASLSTGASWRVCDAASQAVISIWS